jgi:cyclophilin family peptidyl-prolyl cis-trans isomerase
MDRWENARFLRRHFASLACLAALVSVGIGGCNRGDDGSVTPSTDGVSAAADVDLQHPVVRIETSAGPIVVRLDAERAPGTVRNFLNYMGNGFYANSLIHYVAPDKMIVGGGYSMDGLAKTTDPPIRNEAHNGWNNTRGTIAMARDPAAGIDSATSQFYINLADAPSLDHHGDAPDQYGYCVFGEVIEGLSVAEQISRSGTRDLGGDLAQSPDPPVVIKSIGFVR